MDKWLEHILEELHEDAYLWARQCCGFNDELARDVLQVVYLKILEKRATFNERSGLKTWLFSVIRFTAIDTMKKERVHEGLEVVSHVEEEVVSVPVNYEKVIGELPEKQAQVLLLAFYHNMTLAAIAEVMELGIGTIRTHYTRGKEKLKRLISEKQETI